MKTKMQDRAGLDRAMGKFTGLREADQKHQRVHSGAAEPSWVMQANQQWIKRLRICPTDKNCKMSGEGCVSSNRLVRNHMPLVWFEWPTLLSKHLCSSDVAARSH